MTRDDLRQYEPFWDSWYIDESLGHGSFGDVYRIKREGHGRVFYSALKIMSFPKDKAEADEMLMTCGGSYEEAQKRYDEILNGILGEIDIMEQLKGHTNIVSYEDHKIIEHNEGKELGYDIFIRMELLRDLSHCVLEDQAHYLSEPEVIKVGIDMCDALALCHHRNIIHRDIKPANIFVSQDDNYKLGDFGIARSVSDMHLTMSFKGTYNFMAPEIFNRDKYDKRADIYSLGIVLYYMMNNFRVPFYDGTSGTAGMNMKEDALTKRMRGDRLPNPANASAEFSAVILKACEYDQRKRFATVEEFKEALMSLSRGDRVVTGVFAAPVSDDDDEGTVASVSGRKIPEDDNDATVASVGGHNIPDDDDATVASVSGRNVTEDDDATMLSSASRKTSTDDDGDATVLSTTGGTPRAKKKPDEPVKDSQQAIQPQPSAQEGNKNTKIAIVVAVVALLIIVPLAVYVISRNGNGNTEVGTDVVEDTGDNASGGETSVSDDKAGSDSDKDVAGSDTVDTDAAGDGAGSGEDKPKADPKVENVRCKSGSNSFESLITDLNIDLTTGNFAAAGDTFADLLFDWDGDAGTIVITAEDSKNAGSAQNVDGTVSIKSGDYVWEFQPESDEFNTATGKIHITVLDSAAYKGLDAILACPDRSGILSIDLNKCGLSDLSILEGCVNLVVLNAEFNDLTDISALSGTPALQFVSLYGNDNLQDISVLYELKHLSSVNLPDQLSDKAGDFE
ncbi:MAG: protein kinase [Lachnospiraceae bacterium]|nr:protein kinase [Lachnospiraceae bacterium]